MYLYWSPVGEIQFDTAAQGNTVNIKHRHFHEYLCIYVCVCIYICNICGDSLTLSDLWFWVSVSRSSRYWLLWCCGVWWLMAQRNPLSALRLVAWWVCGWTCCWVSSAQHWEDERNYPWEPSSSVLSLLPNCPLPSPPQSWPSSPASPVCWHQCHLPSTLQERRRRRRNTGKYRLVEHL